MFMRLAFSVAAHLEPDILIVDEVLAVGDAAFQKKCLGKLGEVGAEGRTVVFVSHNMAAVNQLCDRAIVLDKGHVILDGETGSVIDSYLTRFAGSSAETCFEPDPTSAAFLTKLTTSTDNGRPTAQFGSDQRVVLEAEFEVRERLDGARLWAWLYGADGTWFVGATDDEANPAAPTVREPGRYVSRFIVPSHVLNEGAYQFRFMIVQYKAMRHWDIYDDKSSGYFEIEDMTDYGDSSFGKRKSLLLLPLAAEERRL
jgi:lipopolysaccharide transport system ATP-binding protein